MLYGLVWWFVFSFVAWDLVVVACWFVFGFRVSGFRLWFSLFWLGVLLVVVCVLCLCWISDNFVV